MEPQVSADRTRVQSGGDGHPAEPVDGYAACRQQVLLDQFRRWLVAQEGLQRAQVGEFAGRLIERYSEDLLGDLLIVADRIPVAAAPAWVRAHFNDALASFGTALRGCAPEPHRHAVAQVLQVQVLNAENRLTSELRQWTTTR